MPTVRPGAEGSADLSARASATGGRPWPKRVMSAPVGEEHGERRQGCRSGCRQPADHSLEDLMSNKQNMDTPHERRPFKDHGHVDVVTLGDFTIGRGVFEAGWRWSDDVKPIAGTDSCMTHHTGICLSGQMAVRFDDGSELTIGP